MSAQINILQALSEANAAYGATRRLINQVKSQRSEAISALLSSYNAFISITDKAEDAREFYSKLEVQVGKVISRVKSVCKVQEEEREERLSAKVKKFSGAGVPTGANKKLDSNSSHDCTSTGPKLKDFLQAGMTGTTIKGIGIQGEFSGVGSNISPVEYAPSSDYASLSYRSSSSRPAPVGSEKTDVRTSCNQPTYSPYSTHHTSTSQYLPSATSQYSPSAPSPVPPPGPQYYPPTSSYHGDGGNYYSSQGNTSLHSSVSSSSNTGTNTYTTVSQANMPYNYQKYSNLPNQSESSASQANVSSTNFASVPSVTSTTTSTMYSQSYGSYQTPYSQYMYNQIPNSAQYNQPTIGQPNNQYPGQQQPSTTVSTMDLPPNQPAAGQGMHSRVYSNGVSYAGGKPTTSTSDPPTTSEANIPNKNSTASSFYAPPAYNQSSGVYSSGVYSALSYSSPHSSAYSSDKLPASTMYNPQVATAHSSNQAYNMPIQSSAGRIYSGPAQLPFDPNKTQSGSAPTPYIQSQSQSNLIPYSQNQHQSGIAPAAAVFPYSQNQLQSGTTASLIAGNQNQPQSNTGSVSYNLGQQPVGTQQLLYQQGQHSISTSTSYFPTQPQNAVAPTAYSQGYSQPSTTALTYNQVQPSNNYGPSIYSSGQPQQSSTETLPYSQNQPQMYGQGVQSIHSNVQSYANGYTPSNSQENSQSLQQGQQSILQPTNLTNSVPKKVAGPSAGAMPKTLKSTQGGISNLDLLSGIDLNVSASSQWSPLTPQSIKSSSSFASTAVSVAPTTVPDVTAAAANSGFSVEIENENISTENEDVLSNQGIPSSYQMAENDTIPTSSSIINLANIAKQARRTTSVVDPLTNDETLNFLALETERFSKFVQGLDKKSLNGPTNLEFKWKELLDILETKCLSLKVSVGRCYPLSNRFPDNLPFDETRVQLPSSRDDYINASYVQLKSIEESIPMILTQAPMPNTYNDFWTMIWENQVEIIVSLNSDAEVKGQIYFPREALDTLEFGSFAISVKQVRCASNGCWIQRTLHLTQSTLKVTKVILHIQFLTWPPSAMPESPGLFLQFLGEVHNLQKQQRNKLKPLVVHCVSGTGRSGVFAVLSSFIKYLQSTGNLADVWTLVIELSQQRRSGIQDRTHLLFLYSAALYYAQEVLMKRGILTDKATFEEGPREKTHVRHPSADLLSSDLNRIKAKLGLDNEEFPNNDTNLSRSGSQSSILSSSSLGTATSASHQPVPSQNESRTPPLCSSVTPSPIHSNFSTHSKTDVKGPKIGTTALPPNLAASLDPDLLVLSTPDPAKPKKITKENFLTVSTGSGLLNQATETSDPLSGLDPLWSLKKN